jgi:precorrin-6A/cobalt-precorrin-6A reductase
MPVLLLGGTGEARALAARLYPDIDVISSLAGRVPDPALPVGPVRIGGFGGADGLRQWLQDNQIDTVVDATHPYAATITATAARVCRELGMAHLVLARPAWSTDGATVVASDRDASDHVAREGFERIFLTTGRSGTQAFVGSRAWFLIRAVTTPDLATLPQRHRVLLSRGPYHLEGESALLSEHHIDVLITKNSGGAMTRPKLDAAAALGIPVLMIDRPALPAGVDRVGAVAEADAWVRTRA